MTIKSFKIAVIKLLNEPTIITVPSVPNGNWQFAPNYVLGQNSNGDDILNIQVEAIRTKQDKQVSIKTLTCYKLVLDGKPGPPSTPHDFELLTLFSQVAFAHTRVMFLNEMKGTIFEDDIIDLMTNQTMFNKIRLAMNLGNN